MRKLIFVFVLALSAFLNVQAQFSGAFYHADPDAWVDKEPYFICRNLYVYNGWGQNLQNITAVINGKDVYSFPYVWEYGTDIVIGRSSGVEFSSGDNVSLFWGNQCDGVWKYEPEFVVTRRKLGGKGANKVLKGAWKYIKRIRL